MFDTCQRHEIDKNRHVLDQNGHQINIPSTKNNKNHEILRRHVVDTDFCVDIMSTSIFVVFVVFCRWYVDLMSILVEYMLSLCRRHQTTCIDFISTQIFVSTWCRQKSRQKVNKNRQKVDQNWSTSCRQTTSERHKGRGKHVSFLSRFLSTSCRQNDYFLSTFCRFLSILVDKKSTKIDKNRPKSTKITCRTCVADALSTKSRQNLGDIFTMYRTFSKIVNIFTYACPNHGRQCAW